MRKQTAFITDDEKVFFDKREAIKHIDQSYGNEIERIAHQILKVEKYADMINFLDEHIEDFAEAIELKRELRAAEKLEVEE